MSTPIAIGLGNVIPSLVDTKQSKFYNYGRSNSYRRVAGEFRALEVN